MRIEDYGPQVHISRRELDNVCYNVVNHFGLNKLYNAALNKCIVPYGCFDSTSKFFGNLGLEVDINGECSNYAHFNLRGVNPEHFGIYRDWQPGEFAPYMKHPSGTLKFSGKQPFITPLGFDLLGFTGIG